MPLLIRDLKNNPYIRENYLGKGAFSKSYILRKDGHTFCGKFIPKNRNHTGKNLDSIEEFAILSKLQHKNIVNFVTCVQTPNNFCLITEYCPYKSMFELIQRRSKLTVYEIRYFSKQLLSALQYVHDNGVIHRDIKPQNMLIDQDMKLKLADFGMAVVCPITCSIYKRHIYGTPNYISPEMIDKTITRYNSKVDIWAVGCFLFHMYTGKIPFRGKEEQTLYSNIQNCRYSLPSDMIASLAALVKSIIVKDPASRPTARQILEDNFYTIGFTPHSLPVTALVEKPKFIVPVTVTKCGERKVSHVSKYCENKCWRRYLSINKDFIDRLLKNRLAVMKKPREADTEGANWYHEVEYPMLAPLVWIEHVVRQNKNIGYVLNDGTRGVVFEDRTVLVLLSNQINLYYVTGDKQIKFYSIYNPSNSLTHKIATLKSVFSVTIPANISSSNNFPGNKDWLPMLPYLHSFYETTKYNVLLMSNGLFEVSGKVNDTIILLCMKTGGFTVIRNRGSLKTYDLHSLSEVSFPAGLHKNLQITYSSLRRVLAKNQCFACKKELSPNNKLGCLPKLSKEETNGK